MLMLLPSLIIHQSSCCRKMFLQASRYVIKRTFLYHLFMSLIGSRTFLWHIYRGFLGDLVFQDFPFYVFNYYLGLLRAWLTLDLDLVGKNRNFYGVAWKICRRLWKWCKESTLKHNKVSGLADLIQQSKNYIAFLLTLTCWVARD